MAVKAAQILHDVHGFVVDRLQSGGVTNVNIATEVIRELGNNQTVATVRDTPDLSFEMESLDVSTEIEALLVGKDPTTVTVGQQIDFLKSMPLDVISPFKSSNSAYDVVKGITIPYLTLENVTYRFGVRANATQTFTLRGDSIHYIPGTPYFQSFSISGTGPYALAHTALPYVEQGVTNYVLGVCLRNPSTGAYKRLFHGTDFTDTATNLTLSVAPDAAYTNVQIVYGSAAAATYAQTVHQGTSVKPAAIRGKDIDIYIGTPAATPTLVHWGGVQSLEVTRRVTLDADDELGNPKHVSQDYDVPEVSGNLVLRPADPADMWTKIAQVANVTTNEIAGPYTSQPLALEARIGDPDTGAILKTIYVPDARFTIPGAQGRVNTKLDLTLPFTSDGGTVYVYRGIPAGQTAL